MATVLVTGCSSGFGKLTALLFGRHGHTVFATVRDPAKVGPLAEVAAEEDIDVRVLTLDVDDPASVAAAVSEAEQVAGGGLDVVVNNAGYELRGPIEQCTDEEVRAQFETNVFGPLRVIRAVLPGMRARHSGVIINVSSIAGLIGRPFAGVYAASKHALEAISETLHFEVAEHGIRVVVIEPGQFETPLLTNAVIAERFDESSPYWASAERFEEALGRLSPDGRRAPAEVVADLIVAVAFDPTASLRHLVGEDAELIISVRTAGSFEAYEQTMRGALDWGR